MQHVIKMLTHYYRQFFLPKDILDNRFHDTLPLCMMPSSLPVNNYICLSTL